MIKNTQVALTPPGNLPGPQKNNIGADANALKTPRRSVPGADPCRPPGGIAPTTGSSALLKQKVLTANLGTQPGLVTTASKDRVVIVCARQAAEDHVPVVLYEPPVSIQAKWQ